MKKILFVLALNCLLLSTQSLCGQLYEMTRYADDSGLPSRIVRDIHQDKQGFIWVAGNNGLFKFDGQKFYPYYSSLKDTVGLRNNQIVTVLAASDHKVWIATPKGLHVLENDVINYVELKENPSDSQNYILELLEDSDQNIWVGTYEGVFVVEKKTGQIRHIVKEGEYLDEEGAIWGITEDRQGRIWVCRSWKPPLVSEKGTYEFRELSFDFEDNLGDKNINPFTYLEYDENTVLINAGVGLLKGSFKNDSTLTVSKLRNNHGKIVGEEFIYNSIIDQDRNIWTGTWKNRFKKYRLVDGNLIEQEVISRNGLLDMTVHARSIYEDSQKNIWIANSNGLYKLSEQKEKIFTFPPSHIDDCLEAELSVYAILEDKAGHIWVSTPWDLYRFNKSDILQGICPTDYIHIKNENIQLARNLLIDSQNRLWIGAEGGLFISQLDTNYNPGEFIRYTEKDGLPHNWSFDIYEENANNFWVGNYAGLLKVSFQEGDLDHPEIKTYEGTRDRSDALVNSYTIDLDKDEDGNLWIGTFHGLSKLISEEVEGSFKNYTNNFGNLNGLSNDAIKKVFKDSSGRLWIGTQTGLNLYDKENDVFVQLGREEGLPSEYILGIQEDSQGFLWIATTNGVIKARYEDQGRRFENIQHFTSQNGLADNITYRNAILIDGDDNVYIGSRDGISVFTNFEPIKDDTDFNLAINSIESTQKEKQGFKPATARITDDEISLSHFENSVKLNYAALDFTNPEYNKYRHKFLPVNDDWIETGALSELTYYNLAQGEYEFILDGSNSRGSWSKNPIRLKLTIRPPFWKSNWAYLLYLLLGAALLRFFYLMRIRKKVKELERETLLEKALVEERELLRQENAADFHDELGSKVTKISLFLTLAERSLKQNDDPLQWFAKIRDNIKGLSGSFRDLLWVIDPKKDSLGDTFLRLKDFGEDLFNTNEINFRTNGLDVAHTDLSLNPQTKKQVVLIFKEAMTNCLKYAKSGQIDLSLKSNGAFSSIELKDNGIGFDVAVKSKGRGLKNMLARAEKINASLKIISSQNGTLVHLSRIPHTSDRFQLQDS